MRLFFALVVGPRIGLTQMPSPPIGQHTSLTSVPIPFRWVARVGQSCHRSPSWVDKTESTVTSVEAAPTYDLSVLSDEEITQLHAISKKLERSITDANT